MKIIVGLGNPGERYIGTRHNIGFVVADLVRERLDFPSWNEKKKLKSYVCEGKIGDEKLIIVKPLTFMNASGEAVSPIVNFYKLPLSSLLIIHDDFDLPLGKIRFRLESKGKSTHNGIRSIVEKLGTPDFPRLRLGVDAESNLEKEVFVLQRFGKHEEDEVKEMVDEAVSKVRLFIKGEAIE